MGLRTRSRRNVVTGALGLALCLAAPFAWAATLDVPVLMHTGAAAWACLALGTVLSLRAWRRDTRSWLATFVCLDFALAALLAFGAFGFARLPRAEGARAATRAPDFELVDHGGTRVRLADELARGPVLLVFFRGSW